MIYCVIFQDNEEFASARAANHAVPFGFFEQTL